MKKLILIAILSLVTMTAFAQDEEINGDIYDEEEVVYIDVYNEIAISDLPKIVSKALKSGHSGATLKKAYINEEATKYKLDVILKDGEALNLYTDSDGNWLEM